MAISETLKLMVSDDVIEVKTFLANAPNMTFVIVLAVILIVVIAVYLSRKVKPVSPFLYSNARVQARSTTLINDQQFNDLMQSKSIDDLQNSLKDTDYAESFSGSDMASFHAAIEKGFVVSVDELTKMSPEIVNPLYRSYLMFTEAKMLKAMYRAKFLDKELDRELIFPVGYITNNVIQHLFEAETIADMSVVLEQTLYNDVFVKKYETIEEFEVALDTFVLNHFIDTAKGVKMFDAEHIANIFVTKVDVMNVVSLLKFRIRGIDKKHQKALLIDTKSKLSERFDAMIEADEMDKFVEAFKGTPYSEAVEKAYEDYEKSKLFISFELELLRFFKKFVIESDLYHTLGPYPLFSYLIKKEFEMRNLFIVSKGIDSGMPLDKIRNMLL